MTHRFPCQDACASEPVDQFFSCQVLQLLTLEAASRKRLPEVEKLWVWMWPGLRQSPRRIEVFLILGSSGADPSRSPAHQGSPVEVRDGGSQGKEYSKVNITSSADASWKICPDGFGSVESGYGPASDIIVDRFGMPARQLIAQDELV